MSDVEHVRGEMFQFTPVVRRATRGAGNGSAKSAFQFTPVVRRATSKYCASVQPNCFNSRPSCDGRHGGNVMMGLQEMFQFTPVVRRATVGNEAAMREALVSIHARRATGDSIILSPLRLHVFQFTPVVRRATGDTTCQGGIC